MNFVKQRVDYHKMTAEKFLEYKKKTLGNSRYVQDPAYYAPDAMEAFGYKEYRNSRISDQQITSVAGVIILSEAHAYQPLELK